MSTPSTQATPMIPRLRFSEFSNEWKEKKLGDVFNRITDKNVTNNKNVLTISAQRGLINQKDFFTKSVSAKNITGYFFLKKNDFAYNRSHSKGYPIGVIKRLVNYDRGVVSTLYICFRLDNANYSEVFFEKYFESRHVNREISKIAQEGARNHGLLNMSVIDFFNDVAIKFPRQLEQQKITNFLGPVDAWINNLQFQKEYLEDYKKGIIQKIFSREIRFKDDNGKDFPGWEDRNFCKILTEHKMKSRGKEEVFSVSVHKGLINQIKHLGRSYSAKNTGHYNLVKPHDVVYTKSPTGRFPFGIIKQSILRKNVIVSPLYGVFTPETSGLGYMLNAYFESNINTHNYLAPIVQKGAKNTMNITNKTFLSRSLVLPVSKKEQQKIADFLISIDTLIESKNSQVTKAKSWKKGLMQQMFV